MFFLLQICFGFVMREFMLSLSDNNQALNSTSRYLDDLLNIDNLYFEQMVGQIYPTELQLNKANSFDTDTLYRHTRKNSHAYWWSFFRRI